MNLQRFARDGGHLIDRYEYDDGTVVAVDFGPIGETSVDVVDDTVIVVTEDGQRELDVPESASDARAFMKNGVLTIELEEDA